MNIQITPTQARLMAEARARKQRLFNPKIKPVEKKAAEPEKPVRIIPQQDAHVTAWRVHLARRGAPIKEFMKYLVEDLGFTWDDLIGESRSGNMVKMRRHVYAEAYVKFKPSLPELGRIVKRDHTTILHHLRCAGVLTKAEAPTNKSGIKGIRWKESHQAWVIEIKVAGYNKFLGYHKDLEAARQALLDFLGLKEFPPEMWQAPDK